MRSRTRIPRVSRGLLAALLLALAGAAAGAEESFYLVELGGGVVGAVHEVTTPLAGDAVETRSDLELALNRQGARVEMSVRATFVEEGGSLRRATLASRFSQQTTLLEAEVDGETLRVRTSSGAEGAAWSERALPIPGALLGPEGLRRRSRAELRAPGDALDAWVFVPELGGIFALHRRAGEREAGPQGWLEVEESFVGLPLLRTLWLDPEGRVARQTEPSPFGPMELRRATAAEAARARLGGSLPAEVYARTLIHSPVRLPAPRAIDRVRLALHRHQGALPWPELGGDWQEVVESGPQRLVLEVRRPAAPRSPVPRLPAPDDPELRPYVTTNAVIESEDPEIRRLAEEIAGSEGDAYRAALLLSAWVHREMRFDLGIAFAPASELVRARRGTCVGYAVLLAALARAAGIPSRFVMGYVYSLGIWGGHAWVELRLGEQWVPFDAALYAHGPADAARFAFLRTALDQGLGAELLAGGQLYGNLDLEILAYDLGGATATPAEGSQPFAVAGATYRNPGLGLRLEAPPGFSFSRLDAVWPDPTLLALEDGRGGRVALREEPGAPPLAAEAAVRARLAAHGVSGALRRRRAGGWTAWMGEGAERAAAAFVDGTTIYTLVAEGTRARSALRAVLGRLRWERSPAPRLP